MSVESGTTIASLDASWPLSNDYIQEGDNHLRLLKAVLKAQFPGAGGVGFSTPITASEEELNYVDGVTSNIQAQLNSISAVSGIEIPSGTVMLFYQAAAPVGWTQISNDDNSMLRMVSGAGGGFGGTDSPISLDYSHVHATTGHSLTIAEMASHTHNIAADKGTSSVNGSFARVDAGPQTLTLTTASAGSGDAHTHGDTASGGATFTPRYIDVIQASKD